MSSLRGFLKVTIQAEPGWHVGAEDDHFGGSQGLHNDNGVPLLPVTSLMGSLREHVRRLGKTPMGVCLRDQLDHRQGNLEDALLGPQPSTKASNTVDNDGLSASPLWGLSVDITCHDGRTALGEAEVSERSRTAVDRHRGAASAKMLRQVSEVGVGTVITLRLRLDKPDKVLEAVAQAILAWRPTLGGGVSTGSGQATVSQVKYGLIDLTRDDDLIKLWSHSGRELVDRVATTAACANGQAPTDQPVIVNERFILGGDLRIGSGTPEISLGRFMDHDQRGEQYLVHLGNEYIAPGTTWKGVVRSRFEYILRTTATAYGKDEEEVLQRLACTDRQECAKAAKRAATDPPPTGDQSILPAGCLTCRVFGSENRAGELVFHNATVRHVEVTARTRNAIDRFTGGVRTGALFAETTLKGCAGDPVSDGSSSPTNDRCPRVDLVITQMPSKPGDLISNDDVSLAIRKILALVVQDLGEGLVGIGSRGSTGLGTLRFAEAEDRHAADLLSANDIECLLEAPPHPVPPPVAQKPANSPTQVRDDAPGNAFKAPEIDRTGTGTLVGYGEQRWDQVARVLAGMSAVWFGIDGTQFGLVPDKAPIGATHLWAWSDDRLARARIEGEAAIVAVLQIGEDVGTDNVVPYMKVNGGDIMLSVHDGRLGNNQTTHELVQKPMTLYVVSGATPLEFVALRER